MQGNKNIRKTYIIYLMVVAVAVAVAVAVVVVVSS
jgi:hypothetical protein